MKINKNIDRKIYRKYVANHWWLKDYKTIKIDQNYINKIFKKFNIRGYIVQYPNIIEESKNIFVPQFGIIKANLNKLSNKTKFNKYVKFLEIHSYDILNDN